MKISREYKVDVESLRRWARANYKPFSTIQPLWHAVVKAECVKIDTEHLAHELEKRLGIRTNRGKLRTACVKVTFTAAEAREVRRELERDQREQREQTKTKGVRAEVECDTRSTRTGTTK